MLAPRGIYAETAKLLRTHFERFGVRFDFVDMTDLAAVEAALGADTRVVWCETPANPTCRVPNSAFGEMASEESARPVETIEGVTHCVQRAREVMVQGSHRAHSPYALGTQCTD